MRLALLVVLRLFREIEEHVIIAIVKEFSDRFEVAIRVELHVKHLTEILEVVALVDMVSQVTLLFWRKMFV